MNSSQPDIPVSARIPVIMVETVAPSSKRIAPVEVQSPNLPMLRFGRSKMLEVMKHVSEMNRRFLTVETGKYAMTLTPPRASGALPEANSLGRSSSSRTENQPAS
jgi:hypothetical protein